MYFVLIAGKWDIDHCNSQPQEAVQWGYSNLPKKAAQLNPFLWNAKTSPKLSAKCPERQTDDWYLLIWVSSNNTCLALEATTWVRINSKASVIFAVILWCCKVVIFRSQFIFLLIWTTSITLTRSYIANNFRVFHYTKVKCSAINGTASVFF